MMHMLLDIGYLLIITSINDTLSAVKNMYSNTSYQVIVMSFNDTFESRSKAPQQKALGHKPPG